MAALSEEEAAQLKALQEKEKAPDEPEGGKADLSRVLNISVDLGDDAQVERAFKLGLLTPAQVEKLEGEEGEGEGGEEEGPKRRGFFDGDK